MKILLLVYLAGLLPAYFSLRHSFIKLCGEEGKTATDAVLMVITALCSWITVLVAMTMMTMLSIEAIDGGTSEPEPVPFK